MALLDAGVSADTLNPAVRYIISHQDDLPSIAEIIEVCREYAGDITPPRCPSCSSELVSIIGGRVVLCHDCDWEAA